jgi:hypothetical protein
VDKSSEFDFNNGKGQVESFSVTLLDVITLWHFTGIGNIRTYVYASDGDFPAGDLDSLPYRPTAEEREANPYHVVAKGTGKERLCDIEHTPYGEWIYIRLYRLCRGGQTSPARESTRSFPDTSDYFRK